MSHTGHNAARRLKRQPEGEQMYNPSVFRYKCIGLLKLNSENKGSPGVCKGMQSRIERVANMVPATREDSIKRFLDAASDYGTYVDSDESSDQKVKEIYTSRTMIYKNEEERDRNNARIQKAPKSSFPEEELIDKTEWSCYGSTQVHYLVLDPLDIKKVPNRPDPNVPPEIAEAERQAEEMFDVLSKQLQNLDDHFNNRKKSKDRDRQVVTKVATSSGKGGKISAITPENFGLSIRKIDSAVGHFTVTDIGSIRICLETSSSLMGDSEEDEAQQAGATSPDKSKSPQDKNKIGSKPQQEEEVVSMLPSAQKDNKKKSSNGESEGDGKNKPSPFDPKTFYNFTLKVGQHMQSNVHALKEAVSDDFPGRTKSFGTKVVHRVGKTTEQTFTYMYKLFDGWWRSM